MMSEREREHEHEGNGQPDLTAPMDFSDLAPVEVPVTIGSKQYLLREASEDAAARFRTITLGAARMQDGKVIGVSGSMADAQAVLVAGCLFEVMPNGQQRQLTVPQVRLLPSRVVEQLFDRAQQISGLKPLAKKAETPANGEAQPEGAPEEQAAKN